MNDLRRPPPSPEEEALWRKRFAVFALLRLSGLGLLLLGIAVWLTGLVRPGGWPLVGGLLAFAGVVDALILPHFVRRTWERN